MTRHLQRFIKALELVEPRRKMDICKYEICIELLDKHRGSSVRRMDFLDSDRVVSVTLSTLLRILLSQKDWRYS